MRRPRRTPRAEPSSSSAWRRATSLSGEPDSIRDSSTTRSSPSSTRAVVVAPCGALGLVHQDLGVGERRDLGQVGDDDHLSFRGRARPAHGPTATAASPPIPASTSSNTIVGGPSESTSRSASMTRDSSPPEATLDRLAGAHAGVGGQPELDGLAGTGVLGGVRDVDLHARARQCERRPGARRPRRPAPGPRPGGHARARRAAPRQFDPGPVELGQTVRRGPRRGLPARRPRRAISSRCASTSSSVSPYLRRSCTSWCRRSRTCGQTFVVGLDHVGQAAQLGGAVRQLGPEVDQPRPDRREQLRLAERRHRPRHQVVRRTVVTEQRRSHAAPPAGG